MSGPQDCCYFWNQLNLPTPVILSSNIKCVNPGIVVIKLKSLMNSIKKTFDDLKQLNTEAATLSRLIYREKLKHRQEKSFKALQMINRCLTNYLSMHLPFVISTIHDTLYNDVGPTRQMAEWALVRLLGTAHLFNRVYHLCVAAAGHLFVKIKLGHLLEITLFSLATVSRIWTLSIFLVKKVCDWYQNLHQFLEALEPSPVPWLPEGCVLPTNIVKTLQNPSYLKFNRVPPPRLMLPHLNMPLAESYQKQLNLLAPDVINIEDLGESIPREFSVESYVQNTEMVSSQEQNHEPLQEKEQKKELSKPISSKVYKQEGGHLAPQEKELKKEVVISSEPHKHSVDEILSCDDLIKFYKIECSSRKLPLKQKTQCLLGHIDKLQWTIIKKFLKKQIVELKKTDKKSQSAKQELLLQYVRENIIKWIS